MKPEKELNLSELHQLLAAATPGEWRISRGLMGDSLNITAYMREGFGGRDGDGPICHVSKERMHFKSAKRGLTKGESRSWKTPIKNAEADAKLIVAAVNALPELLRRLGVQPDETAWLIEWPANKYGPIRYFAAGEPLVMSANDATRFARKQDAEAFIKGEKLIEGARATEHMWIAPKPKKRPASVGRNAKRQDAKRLGPKDEHAVPAGERADAQTPPVSPKKGA